jgi:hypothetical protein
MSRRDASTLVRSSLLFCKPVMIGNDRRTHLMFAVAVVGRMAAGYSYQRRNDFE